MKLLLEKGANIHHKNKVCRTALSCAAEKGHEAVVKLLLEKGAKVDSKDKYSSTALSGAKEKGHDKVVKLLEKDASTQSYPRSKYAMFCQLCTQVTYAIRMDGYTPLKYYHHQDLTSWHSSVSEGCGICRRLFHAMELQQIQIEFAQKTDIESQYQSLSSKSLLLAPPNYFGITVELCKRENFYLTFECRSKGSYTLLMKFSLRDESNYTLSAIYAGSPS